MRLLQKGFFISFLLTALFSLGGCATAPTKTTSASVIALNHSAFMVIVDGAVGVAVSKGVKPSDIATIAYQLREFTNGQSVTVQALTEEIQKLEVKADLNAVQIGAIIVMRDAFDTLIAGYVNNGVISGTAKTTLDEILQDLIAVSELLGAPDPAATLEQPNPLAPGTPAMPARPSSNPSTTEIDGPPAPSPMKATLESPAVVGGATSMVIVAGLQAFAHVSVASPVAASITVLATFLAAWLAAH